MLGNDIVDLSAARKESNWRRRGYLEKIFTQFERNLIKCSSNPDLIVWTLWSIKESVYKAHFRNTHHWEFAPAKIKVENIKITGESAVAEASYHNIKYFAQATFYGCFVHAIALIDPLKFSDIQIVELKTNSRDYTRLLINRNIIKKTEIVVKDKAGIPNITTEEELYKAPVSISHHGNYLGIIVDSAF